MKLYLAAAFLRRVEIQARAAELRQLGHTVTSTWHSAPAASVQDDGVTMHGSPEALAQIAHRDLREVSACEVLVVFTEPGPSRGGAAFESGFALGLGKDLWVVGPRCHFGHHLHALPVFADWAALVEHLREREEANDCEK